MMKELKWRRASDSLWWAMDGTVRYIARNIRGTWRVTMNGAPIGSKEDFVNLAMAKDYVDWGGTPNRMGCDRETGELFGEDV